jgi:hypothetical protein
VVVVGGVVVVIKYQGEYWGLRESRQQRMEKISCRGALCIADYLTLS